MGGAQTHVFQLASYFKKQGHDIAIISSPDGWLNKKAKELDIKTYQNKHLKNSFDPLVLIPAYMEIQENIKEFKPHIIHCHSSVAGILGRIGSHNIPSIYTAHGWSFNDGVPFIQKTIGIITEKIAARYCKKIVCVSNFVRDLGIKYNIAEESKFETIYNGVELSDFNINTRDYSEIKIAFVARLAEPKDPFLLVEAYSSLSNKLIEKSEITIIGDGPQTKQLEQKIKDLKLFKKIRLTGKVERVKVFDYLKQSHIFCLASKWEGFPYTVIEAMNYGLPVIASNVGGIKEALTEETGILIKEYKKEEWTKALIDLISNEKKVKKMGINAMMRVRTHFSIQEMFDKLNNLYKKYYE